MFSFALSILSAAWLALIFCLSHQTGSDTYITSIRIAELIHKFLVRAGICSASDLELINILIRKFAHVALFAVLAVLVLLTLHMLRREHGVNIRTVYGSSFCIFYSWADEATKVWVPGRHFSWFDTGLNIAGCVFGGLFLHFASKVIRRARGR